VHSRLINQELQELYDSYYRFSSSFFNHETLNSDLNSVLVLAKAKWICCSGAMENNNFWSEIQDLVVSGDIDAGRALSSLMLTKKSYVPDSGVEQLYRSNVESIENGVKEISSDRLSQLIFFGGDLWSLNKSESLNISLAKCVAIALNDLFDENEDAFYEFCSLETYINNSTEYCSISQKFLLLESIAAEANRCEDESLWSWVFSRLHSSGFNPDSNSEGQYNEIIRPLSLRCWLKSGNRNYLSSVACPFGVFSEDSKIILQQQAVCSTLFILKNAIYDNKLNQ